jgi:hypothetical protein
MTAEVSVSTAQEFCVADKKIILFIHCNIEGCTSVKFSAHPRTTKVKDVCSLAHITRGDLRAKT